MEDKLHHKIETLLASSKPEELREGLDLVKKEISKVGSEDARSMFEMLSAIFYIDTLERPDLMQYLDEAITLVVGFGKWVIPVLVERLDEGDLKVQIAIANALGRIGADAISPLMEEYESASDIGHKIFILYALSKIKSPKIVQAVSIALVAAQSKDLELRDTATGAIGKLAESIRPSDLSEESRRGFVEKLRNNLSDSNAGIRAKAIKSLGKLARFGHLSKSEKEKLKETIDLIMGTDENYDWDRAYIVRREAGEALDYVK
jgi:HEAT repeat protein